MARHKVVSVEMMKVSRATPKTPFIGWGKYAIRKLTTVASSPELLKYRGCIAGALAGKSYANLAEVQGAFRSAAHACKAKLAGVA
jgi:hypothetical protein